jgi:hypothetical protein
MDRAFSIHGSEKVCTQGLGGRARRKEPTRKTIIVEWILEE